MGNRAVRRVYPEGKALRTLLGYQRLDGSNFRVLAKRGRGLVGKFIKGPVKLGKAGKSALKGNVRYGIVC